MLEARGATAQSRQALEELCRTYRAPVVGYIRSRTRNADDVEDLAQSFFARFIEHAYHAHADPARGSFRAFLLTVLKHFLEDAGERTHAIKRGGNVQFQPLDSLVSGGAIDAARIEERDTPDHVFERAWAEAALRAAMRALQAEAAAAGRSALFDQLCEFLVERPSESDYTRIAAALNMRRNTIAVAVHRLRQRLHELVRAELAETAADAPGAEREFTALRKSMAVLLPPAS